MTLSRSLMRRFVAGLALLVAGLLGRKAEAACGTCHQVTDHGHVYYYCGLWLDMECSVPPDGSNCIDTSGGCVS